MHVRHPIPRSARTLRRNAETPTATQSQLVAECNKLYPPVPAGKAILTFGVASVNQTKRRNDCLAAAVRGQPDPMATVKDDPALLWRVKEPWTNRQANTAGLTAYIGGKIGAGTTGAEVLRATAKGWRPIDVAKFKELEQKATIVGGITALSLIGDPIYSTAPEMPILRLDNDKSSSVLMGTVSKLSKQEGKNIPFTLKDHAEYIRQRVTDAKAEGIAWYARAVAMALAGQNASDNRAKVEQTISTGVSLGSNIAYASVIGAPIGVLLDMIAVGFAAQSAKTQLENARIDGDIGLFKQGIEQEIKRRQMSISKDLVSKQIDVAKKILTEQTRQAEETGLLISQFITAAVAGTVIGGTGLLGLSIVRSIRRRKQGRLS